MSIKNVGLVVPTLGTRPASLVDCLTSIKSTGCENVCLIGPKNSISNFSGLNDFFSIFIEDPGAGLPEAINQGIHALPKNVEFVGWLSDDDLLAKDSISVSLEVFLNSNEVVATYGSCEYIDTENNRIFSNKSGQWASKYMKFLPNLIPQPGSLYRRSAFQRVGGVHSTYPLAFDFELFFNLKEVGELRYVPKLQSYFRWHPDSLTVEQRQQAVRQSSEIRKKYIPHCVKYLSVFWEPLLILVTLGMGKILNIKIKNRL